MAAARSGEMRRYSSNAWQCWANAASASSVSSAAGTLLAVTYDAGDHPVFITDARGVTIARELDPLERLVYGYNPLGRTDYNTYSAQGITQHTDALGHATGAP